MLGSKKADASSPGSTPAGMFHATFAIRATSAKLLAWSPDPRTRNASSFHSMSCSLASSRCAAIFLAFSLTRPAATFTAEPQTAVERLPYVPQPCGVVSVSPWTISTFSTG